MISPRAYEEEYLKGKSPAQLQSQIRSLKQRIGHLKRIIEHPDYQLHERIEPTELTQIKCCRMYLSRTILALTSSGTPYVPSKAEQESAEFDAKIPLVKKMIFTIGGFFSGKKTTTVVNIGNRIQVTEETFPPQSLTEKGCRWDMPREQFLQGLADLHLGEWRRDYNLLRYGVAVMDGTQWELELSFSDGSRPVRFAGDNAYPYNFEDLELLLTCANTTEDDEYDQEV